MSVYILNERIPIRMMILSFSYKLRFDPNFRCYSIMNVLANFWIPVFIQFEQARDPIDTASVTLKRLVSILSAHQSLLSNPVKSWTLDSTPFSNRRIVSMLNGILS